MLTETLPHETESETKMGTTYTATLNIQCLKKHTCVSCESGFSYLLTRNIKAEGVSRELAQENASKLAMNSMANDVDFHPCPNCGIVQPEMTADKKSSWYSLGVVIGVVVLLVAFFCGLAQAMRISTSGFVALVGLGVSCLCYLRGAIYNPNSNLHSNLSVAQKSIDTKQLILDDPKPGSGATAGLNIAGFQSGDFTGFIFGALGLLALAAPLLLSTVNGWHKNESTYPAVIGAGDKTTFYFNQDIKSLQNYWRGMTSVQVTNAAEVGLEGAAFQGKTKDGDWGTSISGKSLSNKTNKMWVQVESPADLPDVNGKKVVFDLMVNARFPFEVNRGFMEKNQKFQHSASAVYSSPGAGGIYYSSWLYGQIAGFVLMLIGVGCHFGATTSLRQRGNPTDVITLGGAVDDEEGLEVPPEENV